MKKRVSPSLLRPEYPLRERMRLLTRTGLLLLLMVAAALPVRAQNSCSDNCVEVGAWRVNVGLGAGVRSNPLNGGEDIPLLVLPEISFYGERFFLKNLEMGFTLFENDRHQLNALVTPGYDQMYFNRWDPFNFSDSGGVTSAGAVSAPIASSAYEVNITGPMTLDSEGASPSNPSTAPSGVYIPRAQSIFINNQPIELRAGTQYLFGSEGNPIAVEIANDMVSIMGVVEGDRVELAGVNFSGVGDVDTRGNAEVEFSGADSGADRLLIDASDDGRYRVTASATAESSVAHSITTEQVAHRKMAGLAGLEYSYTFPYMSLHLQALSDFTSVHGGHEVRAAVIFPWQIGEQKWAASIGGNYKSRHILAYYYGVDTRDTDINALHFSPASAGIEGMVRLDWQLPLNDKWSLRAMLQYSELPDTIANSPLVSERGVGSAFFGGIYHF